MIKINLLFLLLFSGYAYSQGQNLVSNPTFLSSEIKTNHYPNELRKNPIMATDWTIIAGAPDFFNDSKSTYLGYPLYNSTENSGGKIGLRMTNSTNEPEAVATKLTQELVKGKHYKISFSLIQSNYSNFSMNMIPFILSNDKPTKENLITQNPSQHLCFLETKKNYLASDGWITVSFIYEAKGGEKHFTLLNNVNNFARQEKSKANRMPFSFSDNQLVESSYYFFSKISVALTDEISNCAPIELSSDPKSLDSESPEIMAENIKTLTKLGVFEIKEPILANSNLFQPHHIFLIDISNSMTSVIEKVKSEAIGIISRLQANQTISLVVFNETSQIICSRATKEIAISNIMKLRASDKTNLRAGLEDMKSLISQDEMVVLEVFTDEITGAQQYIQSNQFGNFIQTNEGWYYREYETKLSSQALSKLLENPVYKDDVATLFKNPSVYFNLKKTNLTDFQYATECDSDIRNPASISINHGIEKSTNFVYLIDVSASMNENNKMDELKKSILQYNETLDEMNHVSLVSFSSTVTVLLEGLHPRNKEFETTIHEVKGKGATKIDDGIQHIYENYAQREDENLSFILFSDGEFTLSHASEKLILEHPEIHLTIFQFGDRKNKRLIELTNNQKLVYRKVKPSNVKNELILAEQEFPFPKKFSLEQPSIWKYFQNNILEITSKGYYD